MNILYHLSPDDYVYMVLFLALGTIGARGLVKFRHSANVLGYNFSLFALLLGVSYACYSVPDLFAPSLSTLRSISTLGDIFLYASLLIQGRILWLALLKERLAFVYVAIPIIVVSVIILAIDYYTYALVAVDGNVIGHEILIVSVLKGLLLLGLLLPIGLYFLISGLSQAGMHARLKSIMIGITYLVPGSLQAFNDFVNQGNDTDFSIAIDCIVFLLLILVVLPKRIRSK